jgi:predicted aminopeptidase
VYARTYRSVETERLAKQRVFDDMLKQALAINPNSRIQRQHAAHSWNNARLNTIAAYYSLVPGFERLLQKHGNDLDAFHREVADMRKLDNAERLKKLATPKS